MHPDTRELADMHRQALACSSPTGAHRSVLSDDRYWQW